MITWQAGRTLGRVVRGLGWGGMGGAGALALAAAALAQPTVYRPVIVNGQGVGGLGGGHTVLGFVDTSIGPGGHVVAIMEVDSAGVTGVIITPATIGATPTIIAISGMAAPGAAAGVVFASFSNAWADAQGRVVIEAFVSGTGVTTANDRGIWVHDGAVLRPVVREGQSVAGISGLPASTTISGFSAAAFNAGRVVFAATLAGPSISNGNDRSLWFHVGTSLSMFAREGSASVVAGATWGSSLGEPVINSAGTVAFQASLNTGNSGNNEVIVVGSPAAMASATVVFRDGDQAPGLDAGVLLNGPFAEAGSFGSQGLGFNNDADVLLRSDLRGGGVLTSTDSALVSRVAGVKSTVYQQGDAMLGFVGVLPPRMGPPGAVSLGRQGAASWRSELTGAFLDQSTDQHVFRRTATGAVHRVIREGLQAPGEQAGVVFGDDNPALYFPTVACNATGQVVLEATVIGGPFSTPQTRLWVNDPSDNTTHRLARPQQAVIVVGHATVTAATVAGGAVHHIAGTQIGRPTSISDSGEVLLVGGIVSASTPAVLINGAFVVNMGPATIGACCRGSICEATTAAACGGAFSVFAGVGTACAAPVPTGSAISPCCLADFNHVGGVTVQDVFDFLAAFFAGGALADINGAGGVTVQDVFDYLGAYFAGCV